MIKKTQGAVWKSLKWLGGSLVASVLGAIFIQYIVFPPAEARLGYTVEQTTFLNPSEIDKSIEDDITISFMGKNYKNIHFISVSLAAIGDKDIVSKQGESGDPLRIDYGDCAPFHVFADAVSSSKAAAANLAKTTQTNTMEIFFKLLPAGESIKINMLAEKSCDINSITIQGRIADVQSISKIKSDADKEKKQKPVPNWVWGFIFGFLTLLVVVNILLAIIEARNKSKAVLTEEQGEKLITKLDNVVEYVIEEQKYDEEDRLGNKPKAMVELYEKFKAGILNLSDDIKLVPRKFYIAFKKERNICDIEIQNKQLKIFINAKWGELEDRLGVAKNVSRIGHYGNGDYEINISDDTHLDYIIGLIAQTLR